MATNNTNNRRPNRAAKFAWAMYYRAVEDGHRQALNTLQQLNSLPPATPQFVLDELKEMMVELKRKTDCPICLETVEPEVLKIARCGHKYCQPCYDRIKAINPSKCAVCRKRI